MLDTLEERRRFAGLMIALSDYYRQEISKAVMALYWSGLKQYDFEAIEKAAWAHTQTGDESGRWMPKISDFSKVLVGRSDDQAAIAWSKVDSAVRRIGTYADVAFDDAIIHRVIADLGGWILVGSKEEKEWPFLAKDFQSRYRGYRMRAEAPEYPPVLIGMTNAHNGKEGFSLVGAVLIGDIEAAKKVLKGGSMNQLVTMMLAAESLKIPETGGRNEPGTGT